MNILILASNYARISLFYWLYQLVIPDCRFRVWKGIDMDFAKLKAPTLKELFIQELESMILSGKLEIGEKLPSERVLAEKMQVSRAVVNSGITEPLDAITLPYLVPHISVFSGFTVLAFATNTFSIIAFEIPIALIG